MDKSPKITVLMSVYNAEKYLKEAINSILNQTFTDFEFIIINDSSTDSSLEIIKSYSDKRIILINNLINQGLAASLNTGIEVARGEYMARMDADDISLPTRLAKQVEFLDQHPEIGVVGAWAYIINDQKTLWRNPVNHEDIAARFLFLCCILHPTVMLRTSLLKTTGLSYDKSLRSAQDYALWTALLPHTRFANLKEPLLHYRISDTSTSATRRAEQLANTWQIQSSLLSKLGVTLLNDSQYLHSTAYPPDPTTATAFLTQKALWLQNIKTANIESKQYDKTALNHALHDVWWEACAHRTTSWQTLYQGVRNPLFIVSLRSLLKFGIIVMKNLVLYIKSSLYNYKDNSN